MTTRNCWVTIDHFDKVLIFAMTAAYLLDFFSISGTFTISKIILRTSEMVQKICDEPVQKKKQERLV